MILKKIWGFDCKQFLCHFVWHFKGTKLFPSWEISSWNIPIKDSPAKSNKMTFENVESCKNRGSNYNLRICINIWSNDTFVVQSAIKTTDNWPIFYDRIKTMKTVFYLVLQDKTIIQQFLLKKRYLSSGKLLKIYLIFFNLNKIFWQNLFKSKWFKLSVRKYFKKDDT